MKLKRIAEVKNSMPSQRGQSLAELALLTPLLLMLALGVIEVGRYAYITILVGNAARAGAAYGSKGLTASADTAAIAAAANNDYQSANNGGFTSKTQGKTTVSTLDVSSSVDCWCDSAGLLTGAPFGCSVSQNACSSGSHWAVIVHVSAGGTYNSLFNYPGIPSQLKVTNTAHMRVQLQ